METSRLYPITDENTREFVTNFSALYPDEWEQVVGQDTFGTDTSRYVVAKRLYPEESEGIVYSMVTGQVPPDEVERVMEQVKAEEAEEGQVRDKVAMQWVPAHRVLTVSKLLSRRPSRPHPQCPSEIRRPNYGRA